MVGLLIVGGAPIFAILLLGALTFGFALSAVEVLTSAIISEEFRENRQSIFFLWGVINATGATIGHAGLGRWVRHTEVAHTTWRTGYMAVSVTMIGLIVWGLFLSTRRASEQQAQGATQSNRSLRTAACQSRRR